MRGLAVVTKRLLGKGVELPAVGSLQTATSAEELDYQSLAGLFTSLPDIPQDLLERFHMVRQMDRILETVRAPPLDYCSPDRICNIATAFAARYKCSNACWAVSAPMPANTVL